MIRNICLLLSFGISTLAAAPQVVTLVSGEKLIGELLPKSDDSIVVIRSDLLGELSFPRHRVASIVEEKPVVAVAQPAPPVPVVAAPKPSPVPASVVAKQDELEQAVKEERKITDVLNDFKAPDSWSGNLRFGINLSQGDRRWAETYSRGKLEIKPKGSANFYRFTGSYTYRQTERSDGSEFKSTDRYDLGFIYRRTVYNDWFFQNSITGRVDQIKGIDREIQEAIGVGYKYKPNEKLELVLGGGGGVEDFRADFEDTRTGLNPVANIFQEATWRPLKRTSFVQKFNYYWNPEDSEQFNYVLSAAVRVRLTDLLGLEFSFNKNFDNDVGDGSNRDDTQWRNALVVYF